MFTKHNTNSISSARGMLNKRKYTPDLTVEEWDRHQFAWNASSSYFSRARKHIYSVFCYIPMSTSKTLHLISLLPWTFLQTPSVSSVGTGHSAVSPIPPPSLSPYNPAEPVWRNPACARVCVRACVCLRWEAAEKSVKENLERRAKAGWKWGVEGQTQQKGRADRNEKEERDAGKSVMWAWCLWQSRCLSQWVPWPGDQPAHATASWPGALTGGGAPTHTDKKDLKLFPPDPPVLDDVFLWVGQPQQASGM